MQKKRTTASGSKTKKTTAKKRTSSKRTYKKAKVSIPAYKVIILCAGIIAVCMLLLLVTNLPETNHDGEPSQLAQRFEPGKPSDSADIPKVSKKKTSKQTKDYKEGKVSKKETEKQKTKETAKTEKPAVPASPSEQAANLKPPAETKPAQSAGKTTEKTSVPEKTASSETSKSKADTVITPPAASVSTKPTVTTPSETQTPSTPKTVTKSFDFPNAVRNAQLIFVFDDGGQNMKQLEQFMSLPFPITVAVLPSLANSKAAADRVRKSGNEVILHQPMQSIDPKINPGPGAITPDMNEAQIISQLFININEIGPVAGMNNHEGSGITADADTMALILQTASENGIYFLDSRTNVETKVPYVAGELGYSYYERNIFLDNTKTRENVLSELKKGLAIANKTGTAIMIGHIWSADYLPALLKEVYPELKAKGYSFTTVSKSNALKN